MKIFPSCELIKTDRGSYSNRDIVRAVDLVKKNEASIRCASKMCGINYRTLSRYCKRLTGDDALEENGESLFTVGYKSRRQVFPNALEEELVEYILTASSMYKTFRLTKYESLPISWL